MKNMTVVFSAAFMIVLVVIGAMHLLRKSAPTVLTPQQQNTMLGPFSFIATLYAFLLGFVVVNLWQTFNEAGRVTAREAETIGVLYRLCEGLPGGHSVQSALHQYSKSVIEDEWPAMAEGKTSEKTEAACNRIWAEARTISPALPGEQALYAKFVDQLSQLSSHRRDRMLLSDTSLPGILWGTLFVGGLMLLVGLYFLSVSSTRVQIVVDVIVIGMLVLMLYLAVEFSGPFQGNVKVSPKAFEVMETKLPQLH
jgi:hypothetical protein